MAIKIEIIIDIGRKSFGCTRFGVCSITVGAELSALKPNQSPGIFEWEQGASQARIYFRDRESLSEQGIKAVVIDRAIVADIPCANADVIIRRGRYAVESSIGGDFITVQIGLL